MVRDAGYEFAVAVGEFDGKDESVEHLAARTLATFDLGHTAVESVFGVFLERPEVLPVITIEPYGTSTLDTAESKQLGDRRASTLYRHVEERHRMNETVRQLVPAGAIGQQPVLPVLNDSDASGEAMANERHNFGFGWCLHAPKLAGAMFGLAISAAVRHNAGMELDRFEWLSLRTEAAIDPTQQIIDPHHHLWNRNDSTYLANELLADTGNTHNVTHTVFVECRSKWDRTAEPHLAPVGETRFVAGEAAEMAERDGAVIGAIVSHADLTLGEAVGEVLAAHEAVGAGLFRGVRHATPWDEDPRAHNAHTGSTQHMMQSADFVAGARTLASMGYRFDSWLYHHQIHELVELARAVPELPIVLDHLGGRLGIGGYGERRDQVHVAWKTAMTAAAQCPNIVLKVGGIGMDDTFGTGWSALPTPPSSEQVAEYWSDDVRWCIDTFGPERCMFESNFPVDRQSLPYPVLWNAMQIMARNYTDAEQAKLFVGTAARTYDIALDEAALDETALDETAVTDAQASGA